MTGLDNFLGVQAPADTKQRLSAIEQSLSTLGGGGSSGLRSRSTPRAGVDIQNIQAPTGRAVGRQRSASANVSTPTAVRPDLRYSLPTSADPSAATDYRPSYSRTPDPDSTYRNQEGWWTQSPFDKGSRRSAPHLAKTAGDRPNTQGADAPRMNETGQERIHRLMREYISGDRTWNEILTTIRRTAERGAPQTGAWDDFEDQPQYSINYKTAPDPAREHLVKQKLIKMFGMEGVNPGWVPEGYVPRPDPEYFREFGYVDPVPVGSAIPRPWVETSRPGDAVQRDALTMAIDRLINDTGRRDLPEGSASTLRNR